MKSLNQTTSVHCPMDRTIPISNKARWTKGYKIAGKHTHFLVPSNEGSLKVALTAIAISSALPQLVATSVVQTSPPAPPWTELNEMGLRAQRRLL